MTLYNVPTASRTELIRKRYRCIPPPTTISKIRAFEKTTFELCIQQMHLILSQQKDQCPWKKNFMLLTLQSLYSLYLLTGAFDITCRVILIIFLSFQLSQVREKPVEVNWDQMKNLFALLSCNVEINPQINMSVPVFDFWNIFRKFI